MTNSLLLPILYAGLGGTALALIVATAQQKWSCRVFFLLTLRLAIGWHFLFEGLHKIHSHHMGPSETNRVFSSEPYFKVAPGPLGPLMRKQFDDPAAVIAAQVKAAEDISPEAFAKLSVEKQAEACPEPVATALTVPIELVETAIKTEAVDEIKAADAAQKKGLDAAEAAEAKGLRELLSDDAKGRAKVVAEAAADRKKVLADSEKARKSAKEKAEAFKELAPLRIVAAKAAYARWVYGAEGRDAKVKGVTGDVSLTAPQRLAHLDVLRGEVKAEEDRIAANLGNGFGIDQKKAGELRLDLVVAEADLSKDAQAYATDLKKFLIGKLPEETKERTRGQRMDVFTMWFITIVGACLMAGLFTRIMCVLGTGFLVMTYLTHPPFPWFPLPPATEGNPLFINKNVLEALALMVLATFPTGRWLGLDAMIARVCGCGRKTDPSV